MQNRDPRLRAAAERALAYLAEMDPLPASPVDAIIGFGVFDLKLPAFCGKLFRARVAPRIIFTGGGGAGTGNLGGPEAEVWRESLRTTHPDIPDSAVIVEARSTNTAENIAFTAQMLAEDHPELALGRGLRTAIIVASPSRLRRVLLTLRQHQPGLQVFRRLPAFSFEGEETLYRTQGIDYVAHLAGELDRIIAYPARGWIAPETLPPEIADAHQVLRL